jgi:hypothetical protein
MLSPLLLLPYPYPVPLQIRELPFPHRVFLFSQIFRLGHLPWHLRIVKHSLRNLPSRDVQAHRPRKQVLLLAIARIRRRVFL